MKFETLLDILGPRVVFDTSVLLVGDVHPRSVYSQLSRWVRAGKLHQLRRGVYAVAEPYARSRPDRLEIANLLVRPSYVSEESALAFYGLIPEAVFTVSSVTTARQGHWSTPLGEFGYRHISGELFWGYTTVTLGDGGSAFVARPEKALLDLVYYRRGGDDPAFLRSLRLDRLEELDPARLMDMARKADKAKLMRAAELIGRMIMNAEEVRAGS
jgi:predicted transcriptional regulator of viral defense system